MVKKKTMKVAKRQSRSAKAPTRTPGRKVSTKVARKTTRAVRKTSHRAVAGGAARKTAAARSRRADRTVNAGRSAPPSILSAVAGTADPALAADLGERRIEHVPKSDAQRTINDQRAMLGDHFVSARIEPEGKGKLATVVIDYRP